MKNQNLFFLKNFSDVISKYFLINKNTYQNAGVLPCVGKIVCTFRLIDTKLESLSVFVHVLESRFEQKAKIKRSKKSSLVFKIRKGFPSGCIITLQKARLFQALEKITFENVTQKSCKVLSKQLCGDFISHSLANQFENSGVKNYYYYSKTKNINVIVTASRSKKFELAYILKINQFFDCDF